VHTDEVELRRVSERIIGCAFAVANTLGSGFVEKVYENALALELRDAGLAVQQQRSAVVKYKGMTVGEYVVDLLVEGSVIVELKAVKGLDDIHRAQCLNYLKATGPRLCLLINLSRLRLEIKRLIL